MTVRNLTTACLALAVAGSLAAPAARAAGDTACRGAMTGTYLATVVKGANSFVARVLVTLHRDGTLSVIDSHQHRGVQGSSFSAQQGAYRCLDARTARARTLNFGFPEHASIARGDWTIVKERPNGFIVGDITVSIYPGVKGVDPFAAKGGKRIGTYRYIGVPLVPPAK